MNMQVLDARRNANGEYKVDVSHGERIGGVSSEWFSRPANERYFSLSESALCAPSIVSRCRYRSAS